MTQSTDETIEIKELVKKILAHHDIEETISEWLIEMVAIDRAIGQKELKQSDVFVRSMKSNMSFQSKFLDACVSCLK